MLKFKVTQLDLLKKLTPDQYGAVLYEYQRGRHALTIIAIILLVIFLNFVYFFSDSFVAEINWFYRLIIVWGAAFVILFIGNLIYVNLVAPKIIKDIVKKLRATTNFHELN